MTVQANAPAAPPSTPTAPAPETAATPAAPSRGRSALAASLVGIDVDDDGPTPEQPAPPTFTPNEPTTPPGEAPAPPGSRLANLQAKLLKDRQEREAKRAQDEQAEKNTKLEKQLAEMQGKPSYDAFVEEFKRSPVATAKKFGMNPRELLEALTQDALAPGSLAAQAVASDAESKGQKALDAIEQMRQEQAARERAAAGHQNNLQFLNITSDAAKYPRMAPLDNDERLQLALEADRYLHSIGQPFDLGTIIEFVEARLEKLHNAWAPQAPAAPTSPKTAPSSSTSPTPPTHAASKQPPKTITPALVGASSGSARRQTPKERREALANSLVAVDTD